MSYEAINNLDNQSRAAEITTSAEKLLGRHEVVSKKLEQISIQPRELIREGDPNDLYTLDSVLKDE